MYLKWFSHTEQKAHTGQKSPKGRQTEVLYNHTTTHMVMHWNMPTDQQQALSKHNAPTESSIWISSLSTAYKNSFGTQKTCYFYKLFCAVVVTTLKKTTIYQVLSNINMQLWRNIYLVNIKTCTHVNEATRMNQFPFKWITKRNKFCK